MLNVIKNLYSVFDRKALYGPLFTAVTDGDASRMAAQALTDPNSMLSKFPADYRLDCVGSFNAETGELIPMKPKFVAELTSLMPRTTPEQKAS